MIGGMEIRHLSIESITETKNAYRRFYSINPDTSRDSHLRLLDLHPRVPALAVRGKLAVLLCPTKVLPC